MNAFTIAAAAVLAFTFLQPAHAGEVYKCKDAKGNITFTNIKCPDKSEAQHYGTYQPTQDSPDQYFEASDAADAIHAQRALGNAGAAMRPRDADMDRRSDHAAIDNEDTRTAVGRQSRSERVRCEDIRNSTARQRCISNARERLHASVDGREPVLEQAPPTIIRKQSRADQQEERARVPVTQNCNSDGGFATCFGSDGSISHGASDGAGGATMFNSKGSIQHLNNMDQPSSTHFCDANGNCN